MEPLKEMFNAAFYKHFAAVFSKVYKKFPSADFYKAVTTDLDTYSLNQRLRNTSVVLHKYLPGNYPRAIKILYAAAPHLKKGYTALVLPDFVALYGRKDFDISMQALKHFTTFGSSEFAVREFLKSDLQKTLKVMQEWAADPDPHVRRLASEGSRPRLPWSFKLEDIIKKPSLTIPILEILKRDNNLYVKKSVANHLNDISKDNPAYMLSIVTGWDITNPDTRWIVKHASRSLIKQGHPGSLSLFSFEKNVRVAVDYFRVKSKKIRLGEYLEFDMHLTSKKKTPQKLVIDYVIHYAKASGNASRKVFKWKEVELPPGKSVTLKKRQLFMDFTTRKHHSGDHAIDILINGQVMAGEGFRLSVA